MPSLEFLVDVDDAAETRACLRCLQGLARVFAGPAATELLDALRHAETDPDTLPDVDAAFAKLPTIARRRILSTFAMTLPAGAR